jgi:hypothetical protein
MACPGVQTFVIGNVKFLVEEGSKDSLVNEFTRSSTPGSDAANA